MRSCFLCPTRKVVFSPCYGAWQSSWELFSPFPSLPPGVFKDRFLKGLSTGSSRILGEWQRVHRNSSSLLPGHLSWDSISLISPFKYKLSSKSTLQLNYLTLPSPDVSSRLAPLTQIQMQGLVLLLKPRSAFEDLNDNFASSYHTTQEVLQRRGSPEVQSPPGLACASRLHFPCDLPREDCWDIWTAAMICMGGRGLGMWALPLDA